MTFASMFFVVVRQVGRWASIHGASSLPGIAVLDAPKYKEKYDGDTTSWFLDSRTIESRPSLQLTTWLPFFCFSDPLL
jgi:hypothetical protein